MITIKVFKTELFRQSQIMNFQTIMHGFATPLKDIQQGKHCPIRENDGSPLGRYGQAC